MTARTVTEMILVFLLAVFAAGWCREAGRSGEFKARAEVAQQRADSAYDAALASEKRTAAIFIQAEARILGAERARAEAEVRATQAAASQPAIVERIVTVAATADTGAVREAVSELQESHRAETDALRAALSAVDSIVAAQTRQIEAQARLNATLSAALAASRAEADVREQAARPSLFGLRVGSSTAFSVGVGIGLIAAITLFH